MEHKSRYFGQIKCVFLLFSVNTLAYLVIGLRKTS
jgi:hypothetical protein